MDGWNWLVASHAVAATLALVLGGVQLLRVGASSARGGRRGDRLHRWNGRVWIVLMYVVAGSSFLIQDLQPGSFSWIHVLSVVTIVTMTRGLLAIRRGDVLGHGIAMAANYAGLIGALIGVVAVPSRLVPRAFQADWSGMTLLTLGIAAAAVVGLAALSAAARAVPRPGSVPRSGEVRS